MVWAFSLQVVCPFFRTLGVCVVSLQVKCLIQHVVPFRTQIAMTSPVLLGHLPKKQVQPHSSFVNCVVTAFVPGQQLQQRPRVCEA